jgi:exopolysaccharide production protein ExoQ
VLTFVVFPLAAFFLALLSIVAVIVVAGMASRWSGRLFHYLMFLVVGASVGGILLSERVLTFGDQGLAVVSDADAGSGILAKLLLIAVVGCSVAMCAAWFFVVRNDKRGRYQPLKPTFAPPNDIVVSFMAFYVAFSILPLFFGQKFYFHVSLIYPFFVFLALFLWVQLSDTDPVVIAKQSLAIVVFGSLAAALLAPQLAMQPGYVGLVPGFNLRLWGVTASANTLGSVASVLLVLEAAEPSKRNWIRHSIFAAAGVALVLTQSKTSIVAAVLGLAMVYGWRLLAGIRAGSPAQSKHGTLAATALLALACLVTAMIGAWVMFSDTSILAAIEGKLTARAVGDMSTATGRTDIWRLAIQGGLENPLFGQGADFWGLEARLRSGFTGATHAHNLFLQVFSRSGFIGLASLLVFLYFLVQYSVRASKPTRGGSIALMAVFVIRTVFEVPIQPNAILGAEFFAMMAFFLYAIDRGAKPISAIQEAGPMATNFVKVRC